MTAIAFVFPHQLFADVPVLRGKPQKVLLIEDPLFFGDCAHPARFHKQKLAYHRATMAAYAEMLSQHVTVETLAYSDGSPYLDTLCQALSAEGVTTIALAELHDELLSRRLYRAADSAGLSVDELASEYMINTPAQNQEYRSTRKRWFMADFYQWQRRRLNILMDDDEPCGGRWSFDEDNRKKIPKREIESIPELPQLSCTPLIDAAVDSVARDFPDNPGSLERWYYPITHQQAEAWLHTFLQQRFDKFGPYEDAIVAGQPWLYHSVLTPMLNIGLLTPRQVVDAALRTAQENGTPLNSVEGFIRQVIGWREFMRATYDDLGVRMRTTNHWQHQRRMPEAFYKASTGIEPIDDVIRRINETAYCHHIERLMVLGGFMFLCEIHPDDIYRWFMEMFIDSYDWVMVPNVYAMSQHADGGAITSKPYFSGSNYIYKMSNHRKPRKADDSSDDAETPHWSDIWDSLYWRWIIKNSEPLRKNPRWAMMVATASRMSDDKRARYQRIADDYLQRLSAG